jgi:hypothetical protein
MFAMTRRAISYIAHAIVSAAMLCALVPARAADPIKLGFTK